LSGNDEPNQSLELVVTGRRMPSLQENNRFLRDLYPLEGLQEWSQGCKDYNMRR
jgi:hypothetical protein